MGSSKIYSAGVDLVDVAAVMTALEEINRVRLEVKLNLVWIVGKQVLEMVVSAYDRMGEDGEASALAYQRCRIGYLSPQTMEAAILQALYGVDAQLGEMTLRNEALKKA